MDKCEKCDWPLSFSGVVNCLCDKDYCGGQRCGANELHRRYKCSNPDCDNEGTPGETLSYMKRHCE